MYIVYIDFVCYLQKYQHKNKTFISLLTLFRFLPMESIKSVNLRTD